MMRHGLCVLSLILGCVTSGGLNAAGDTTQAGFGQTPTPAANDPRPSFETTDSTTFSADFSASKEAAAAAGNPTWGRAVGGTTPQPVQVPPYAGETATSLATDPAFREKLFVRKVETERQPGRSSPYGYANSTAHQRQLWAQEEERKRQAVTLTDDNLREAKKDRRYNKEQRRSFNIEWTRRKEGYKSSEKLSRAQRKAQRQLTKDQKKIEDARLRRTQKAELRHSKRKLGDRVAAGYYAGKKAIGAAGREMRGSYQAKQLARTRAREGFDSDISRVHLVGVENPTFAGETEVGAVMETLRPPRPPARDYPQAAQGG